MHVQNVKPPRGDQEKAVQEIGGTQEGSLNASAIAEHAWNAGHAVNCVRSTSELTPQANIPIIPYQKATPPTEQGQGFPP